MKIIYFINQSITCARENADGSIDLVAAAEIKTALASADPDSFDITTGWPD